MDESKIPVGAFANLAAVPRPIQVLFPSPQKIENEGDKVKRVLTSFCRFDKNLFSFDINTSVVIIKQP